MDNERRADLGANAIYAAGRQTGVARCETVSTVISDVLAYVAHFCDRVGLDPESTFAAGINSYLGDFEDGPAAEVVGGGESMSWDELARPRECIKDERDVCDERAAVYPGDAASVTGPWHAESCSAHEPDREEEEPRQAVKVESEPSGDLCMIAFQAEAHDTAARHYQQLANAQLIVRVLPVHGPAFDAELFDVASGEDGQYKARFARWSDQLDGGDHGDIVVLDIYDEVERIEVF